MPLRLPGTPQGVGLAVHDDYVMWDAAYVLGALSSAEWREFEGQMADCPLCRSAVGELSGMPALLSQLDRDELLAIDEVDHNPLPDELLPSLLAQVKWRRSRSRAVVWATAAGAAAVLAIGVLVGFGVHHPTPVPNPPGSVSAQPMTPVGTYSLTSTVAVSGQHWGTFISMHCVCLAPLNAYRDTLAMVVVGRDGSRTRLATWVQNPGHATTPAGSISTPVDQIASVQVISAEDGQVLLERRL
ncbi:anti-sigma factor family protein [Mycobacterium asiaticum]|uniref:Zinc-finger domain-containing protein n=1 Tax=Mycobacterium asiaticum TaxID=1790 RepID=A0A1A3N2G2_MYCAS|nr:hypothetical protein [Mycobacterium asiaticum]OBK15244.1 hypothetical protein A5636_06155 [Mycobacterium asiaticum]